MKKGSKIKRILMGIAKCLLLSVLVAAIVVGVIWADSMAASRSCRGMKVVVERTDSVLFVTPETIFADIEAFGMNPKGEKVNAFNTGTLEKRLAEHDYLESAECVWHTDDILYVTVRQLEPVMRVFDRAGASYYLNATAKRITADSRFHKDVPVITGVYTDSASSAIGDLIPLAQYISSHPELEHYVTAINAADTNNVIIVPNIRGHVVNIGSVKRGSLDNKFAKIRQMYDRVIPVTGWWTYDTISVKWNHQIVATRRNAKKHIEPVYVPEEDELPPDIESITAAPRESAHN